MNEGDTEEALLLPASLLFVGKEGLWGQGDIDITMRGGLPK